MTWHNRADRAPAPPHPGPRRVGRRTASASRSYWSATSRTDGPSSRNASRPWQTLVLERPTGRPRAETTDIARHAAIRAAEPLRNQRAQAVTHLGRLALCTWRADGHRAESLTHDALKVLMDHGWRLAVIDALPLDLRGSLRLRRGARRNLYHRARPAHPGPTVGAHPNPGAPPHLPGRLPQRTGTDPTGQQPGKRPLLCRRCSVTEPPRIDRVQDQT